MKTIREDSFRVEIYNEGLVVFLYDEANSEAIRQANPEILEGFSGEPDQALSRIGRKGILVAYELEQDDELSIEISLGMPLSSEELSKGRWHKIQHAPLSLPSGKLCIEGYNNFRLSPDYDPDEEPGAALDIPSGDYVLTLYRIDWEALEDAGLGEDIEAWGGPWQVITLTKAVDTDPVIDPAPMLLFPMD